MNTRPTPRPRRPWLLRGLLIVAAFLVFAQFLPFGRVENPPVRQEPAWDSPRTRELAVRACFDCHSNESKRQWYHLAPASWWVAHHVEEAREHLNFSELDRPQKDAVEAAEEVEEGEMPLPSYLLVHPAARLSDAERAELVRGLTATFGSDEHGGEAEGREAGGGRGRGRGRGGAGG
jgi:mono/diheme cytochrome c family protein